ncbi:U4/U6.U5 tri-snRNP-associated protein 1-like [Panonychus citri]|uniref:U4/U6.U5 tri-snRNP-associated protein 1-like n=1 Tax=Panonychus citri TaxID=50023 RepID=UPI00230787D8|nr:U4/U6.U5 tri-snRNP-associated protein 1-like [Panonychus citri]
MPSHRSPTRSSKSGNSKSRKSPDRERSKKHKHHRSHEDYDDHHYHHQRDSHRQHESSSRDKSSTVTSNSSIRKSESSSSSRKRQYYSSGDESPERRDDGKRSKVRSKEDKDDGREGTSRRSDSHRDSVKVAKEDNSKSDHQKGLADLDNDEDAEDAAAWVMKSRQIEEKRLAIEKLKAERKARMLDEMDNEIDNQVADRKPKNINELYSEKDLQGLQVAHSEKFLKEGHQFIMTLKDKEVLDEKDDVLENVNLVDLEKAEKNMENKLKKNEYRPYDEPEFDEFGILKKKNILGKYDEELNGVERETFQIGSSMDREKEAELIREKLRQQAGVISLDTPSFKVASEYYTEEELVKFKKPKKIRAKLKKGKRKNISESIISYDSSDDHGSRKNRTTATETAAPMEIDDMSPSTSTKTTPTVGHSGLKLDIPDEEDQSESDSELPDVDLSGILFEEQEAEEEFRRSLERAKRLKERDNEKKEEEERIAKLIAEREAMIKKEQEDDLELPGTSQGNRSTIILNSTAEFCRNLGEFSTFKEEDGDDDDNDDFEKDAIDERKHQVDMITEKTSDEPTRGTWNEVDMEASVASFDSNDATADPMQPILEEEPDVSLGVAAALKVAMKKGYLDKEPRKPIPGSRHSSLQAQNYTIEEKFYDEEKMGRRGDRYNGPLSDFKEKDGYKPDVKLDYVDEKGRMLNQKEAFRVLSHKFHGKGPGKNKIDKRMKKLDQGEKLRQMHSTDTPLGTLKLLQDKQKELHAPYIVLSGASTSLAKK